MTCPRCAHYVLHDFRGRRWCLGPSCYWPDLGKLLALARAIDVIAAAAHLERLGWSGMPGGMTR